MPVNPGIPAAEPSTLPPILFLCDKAPNQGGPHLHMGAIWLKHLGYNVFCVCSGIPGEQSATSFTTPLGDVPAKFLAPYDWEDGAVSKLKWHARFVLELLKTRLRAPKHALFVVHGSGTCPGAWIALAGVPRDRVVYHTQDYLEPGRHKVWAFFEKAFARRAGTVLCNEANRARFMASNYRLKSVPGTIPTGLPQAWFQGMPETPDRAGVLKKLGIEAREGQRLVLHQGPLVTGGRCGDQVLDALALLPPNYELVFTGNRSTYWVAEAEKEVALRPALKGRVHFPDALPYLELLQIGAGFDVGLLLYPNDGVGSFYQAPGRLTEYLGCGLPIVTSRFPGLELLVLKHGIGKAVDPDSPAEIAEAIRSLAERDPETKVQERARLRKVYRDSLSYEHSGPILEQAVREALKKTASA